MTKKPAPLPRKIKYIRKKLGKRLVNKYKNTFKNKNQAELKTALGDLYHVLQVKIDKQTLTISYTDGSSCEITIGFAVVCRLLRFRLFYHPCFGTIVNLCYFEEFKEVNNRINMLLIKNVRVILSKKQEKKARFTQGVFAGKSVYRGY